MTWLQRYRFRQYLGSSIWVCPVLAMVAALLLVGLLHMIETGLGWELGINPETARALLGTMAASMFTFIVFVSSALLVAVQLASGQLTPRIIALLFKAPAIRFSLTVFVFVFTFSLAVLVRVNASVPWLTTYVAAYSFLASLGVFLYLIDRVGKSLRPSGALQAVAALGLRVIEDVFPRRPYESQAAPPVAAEVLAGEPTRTVVALEGGVVLAFDIAGLVSLAQRAGCVIEMVPQVGDFISAGGPLFRLFGGGETITPRQLHHSVAIGQERTLQQDPTFAFRIMVDIASKGLSPAINDPTTAVAAIDQIHHLLRNVGSRQLDDGRVRDAAGRLRLVYRTPNWEDFVHLAVTEIRQFGGLSIQIARRLRAMLEDLIQTLPPECTALLRKELNLLERSAKRFFVEPEDLALAEAGDFQGVGGRHDKVAPHDDRAADQPGRRDHAV
jgi:uncharacterized membrane protein